MEIRPADIMDVDGILNIYEYYVKYTAVTFEYEVPSRGEMQKRIARILEKYPYYVAVDEGRIVGYAYAGPFVGRAAYDWSAELTIYLDVHETRRGLGRKLYESLEQTLRDMGILNLYACIAVPEVPDEYLTRNSAQFHAHMGFQQVGEFHRCGYKFQRWYDMIWMEKIIGEHESKQAEVVPYPQFKN